MNEVDPMLSRSTRARVWRIDTTKHVEEVLGTSTAVLITSYVHACI